MNQPQLIVHTLKNPERFVRLMQVLSITHGVMDDEFGAIMDPRLALPTYGLMRMIVTELEEMMLEAIYPEPDGQREPDTVVDAREELVNHVRSITDADLTETLRLVKALVDSMKHIPQRMSDERLIDILSNDEPEMEEPAPRGDSVPPIFSAFLSKPGIMS